MQQWSVFSWCSLLLLQFLTVGGLYIPTYNTRHSKLTRYELWKRESTSWWSEVKRSHGEYDRFMDSLARQAQRRRQKHRHSFVDDMFRIFDINRDSVIERYEFRAILQVMGIVPSTGMFFG